MVKGDTPLLNSAGRLLGPLNTITRPITDVAIGHRGIETMVTAVHESPRNLQCAPLNWE